MSRSRKRRSTIRSSRRRQNGRKLLYFVLAALLIAALVMLLSSNDRISSPPDDQATSSTSAPNEEPTASQPSEPTPDVEQLKDSLVRFTEVYYRILPSDGPDTRRSAVEQLGIPMSETAIDSMDFTVYAYEDPFGASDRSEVTEQGTVDLPAMQILSELDDGKLLYVTAPVVLTSTGPDGHTETSTFLVGTVWQWVSDDGRWAMTAFGEEGSLQ